MTVKKKYRVTSARMELRWVNSKGDMVRAFPGEVRDDFLDSSVPKLLKAGWIEEVKRKGDDDGEVRE